MGHPDSCDSWIPTHRQGRDGWGTVDGSGNLLFMGRICSHCHAVLANDTEADWCPACGGALIEREGAAELDSPHGLPQEVDHRGIVLPRRHALGGIITPQ
jgi:hypothetical protein